MLWEPKIDAVWVRLIRAELDRLGHDGLAAVRKCKIPEKEIERAGGRVSLSKCDALFEHAARITGDDRFGLHLGQKIDPRELGLLAYLGLSSKNLIDAIENLAHYCRVFTDQFVIRLERKPEGLLVHAVMNGPADFTAKQANEAGLIALLATYRMFSGRQIRPLEVHFRHSRRTGLSSFRKAFGCPVTFESQTTGFLLKEADLAIPLASADDRLLNVLRHYCEDILARRRKNEPPFVTEVSAHIVDLLPKGRATAKSVADEMGLSPRTFLRRLKEADTSFQELLDELRVDLAETYLADPHLHTKEIAFLLGYSSSSAFSHGFRRLSGKAPHEYRLDS